MGLCCFQKPIKKFKSIFVTSWFFLLFDRWILSLSLLYPIGAGEIQGNLLHLLLLNRLEKTHSSDSFVPNSPFFPDSISIIRSIIDSNFLFRFVHCCNRVWVFVYLVVKELGFWKDKTFEVSQLGIFRFDSELKTRNLCLSLKCVYK